MKDAIVALGIILFVCLFGAFTIFTSYLEERQPLMVYQTAYSSNLDCRAHLKGDNLRFIDGVCGPIPQIGDFQK